HARRLLVLIALLLLGGCGKSDAPDAPRPLVGPWEYRWGDSPRDAQGQRTWARPDHDPVAERGWQSSGNRVPPGGRGANQFLWLRTTLPGPEVQNPILYFLIVEQIFEAYLDGQLLYRFGTLDGDDPQARRFLGNRTHMIPLPPGYAGKQLA